MRCYVRLMLGMQATQAAFWIQAQAGHHGVTDIRLAQQAAIVGEERMLNDLGERIRDVRVGPDDAIYVLTDEEDGKVLKIEPPAAK